MRTVKLKELCLMKSGGTPSRKKPQFYNGSIPWAKISDLESSPDGFVYDTEEHITEDGLASINNRLFTRNTLFLAMYGSVGKTAISRVEMSTNQAILGINIKDQKKLDLYYLQYWFRTIKQKLLNRAVGGTLQNISLTIVKDLEIPLPPLEEQKKIAAILDTADHYRQKTKVLIEKYDQLTQSLFLDMFGDPVANPKGWEIDTLKNCTNKIGSGATPRGGKEVYKEVGISFIRSLNIHDNWFKNKDLAFIDDSQACELDGVNVEANDIMFNITGASVCRCCMVPSSILPARVNQHVAIIRSKKEILNSTFLLHCLLSQNVKSHLLAIGGMGGATREALTKSDLETFKIIMPPIELQNQFAERVAQIEKQKQQAEASLVKAEELFNSLMQRAFKGELTN